MISYYEKGTGIQPDLKKLKGKYHGLLRLRVGYLWIILKIVQSALVVLVIDVIHRKDAYQ
jgi:mRNA interferase RelE/StbE